MKRRPLVLLVLVTAILVAAVTVYRLRQPVDPVPPPFERVEFPDDSPSRGNRLAKVTVVLWSDFQCQFCARTVPLFDTLEQSYGDELRIVFRHLPLPFHPQAQLAAEASLAAHEQGAFWPMHTLLYRHGQSLDRARVEALAQELRLDLARFRAALDERKHRAKVDADAREARALGVTGTPTSFINGRRVVGALPLEAFRKVIDEEKQKAEALLAEGVRPDGLYAAALERNLASAVP